MEARVPPHNLEAEEALIGGIMLDPESFLTVFGLVSEQDFYKGAHRKIFAALYELESKGQTPDIITVSNFLSGKKELESIGGAHFLAEIMERIPSSVNIASYAKIVREKALVRKFISTTSSLVEKAYEQNYETVEAFLDEAEGQVYKIAENKETRSGLVGAGELVKKSIDRLTELSSRESEGLTGVPSGFDALDELTAGFQPGELTILAARPSMGKTALSLNIAQHAALHNNLKVAYFSVEMAEEQLMARLLASEARINMSNIRVGRINDNDWPRLIEKASVIAGAPLFVDDTTGISPYEIRAKCRRLKAQHGLDFIIIDYLQIMELKQRVESRERAVAEISKSLKAIAKEFHVPVMALAQLNRGVEGRTRDQKKPLLSDLRESGSIEQDADLIMMLFREEYYDPHDPEIRGKAELLIRKQRNGPLGDVDLQWEAPYGRFSKWEGPIFEDRESQTGNLSSSFSSGKPRNFAPTES